MRRMAHFAELQSCRVAVLKAACVVCVVCVLECHSLLLHALEDLAAGAASRTVHIKNTRRDASMSVCVSIPLSLYQRVRSSVRVFECSSVCV